MDKITKLILKAAAKARAESGCDAPANPAMPSGWPIECVIGPGLEGAVACDSKVGYVNGTRGELIYRGYDIFDLAAYSTYEEVSYLLLHGSLPTREELRDYTERLTEYRNVNYTLRLLMGFPVEEMGAMSAMRMGTNLLRQEFSAMDRKEWHPKNMNIIGADEDSIAMETRALGHMNAVYEFHDRKGARKRHDDPSGLEACYHLISGVGTIAAAIARLQKGKLPVEPDPELGHAANFLYMMNGVRPTEEEARVMDIALIIHADHGMNASTFAAMVVASTLSDFYFSVGAGIAALNGPLHGGANEQVVRTLEQVAAQGDTAGWVERQLAAREKIPGFGHRVYRTYDPRARILGPLAQRLAAARPGLRELYETARTMEKEVVRRLGKEKNIFPNVDFYSGLGYWALGIDPNMYTPIFAVSRVAGWTARVLEYSSNNRIFRPRSRYTGEFGKEFVPLRER